MKVKVYAWLLIVFFVLIGCSFNTAQISMIEGNALNQKVRAWEEYQDRSAEYDFYIGQRERERNRNRRRGSYEGG